LPFGGRSPKRNGALEVEKEKECYKDNGGCFSELLWGGKWASSGKFGIKLILMIKTGHR